MVHRVLSESRAAITERVAFEVLLGHIPYRADLLSALIVNAVESLFQLSTAFLFGKFRERLRACPGRFLDAPASPRERIGDSPAK